MKRKKLLIASALCAAFVIMAAGCGSSKTEQTTVAPDSAVTESGSEENVGLANPWEDYKNIDEAAAAAGFDFGLPSVAGGSKEEAFRTMGDSMIEVIYTDSSGAEAYRIRKGKGQGDISGDYNSYSDSTEYSVGDVKAVLCGNGDGVNLATFTSGDFSYAFLAGTYVPSVEDAEKIVGEMIEKN